MQVEVNAHNIVLYGLEELTGNDTETMLHAARLAELEGQTLMCTIPDPDGTIRHVNSFDHFGGTPAEGDLPDNPLMAEFEKTPQAVKDEYHKIVQGQVISSRDDGDTSHIPFPPDMVPFDDEDV